MNLHRAAFNESELNLIERGPMEEMEIGDRVVLKSGGPESLVVAKDNGVVVAWRLNDGPHEAHFSSRCLRRLA